MLAAVTLGAVAAEQWGLVTTAQARTLGVSAQEVARLTNQGVLERMTHGVYRVFGAPPEPADEVRAAWLALDPGRRAAERAREASPAVVSYRSAAVLHDLGNLDADVHEFTTARRKQSRRPDIKLHRGHVPAGEWTIVDGLPVTTVARTIADLAAARVDGGHLATIVRDALTVKQVSDQVLSAALARYAQRYGAPAGDGQALLARFIQESGVSVPLVRAVELSAARGPQPTQTA
jgi:predicted transcriptional regulator of viral defense system